MRLSRVEVVPLPPRDGLVGFASVVIDDWLYLGGLGIHTTPTGGIRLTYPTKKDGQGRLFELVRPLLADEADQVRAAVSEKWQHIIQEVFL